MGGVILIGITDVIHPGYNLGVVQTMEKVHTLEERIPPAHLSYLSVDQHHYLRKEYMTTMANAQRAPPTQQNNDLLSRPQ